MKTLEEKIETLKHVKEVMSFQNTKDNAIIGYYNGVEHCLAYLEDREPIYKKYI